MNMLTRLAIVAGALTLTAGCASGGEGDSALSQGATATTPPAAQPVPTDRYTPGDLWMAAALRGTVTAMKDGDRDCIVLRTPGGRLVPIVWPAGYSARFSDPAELLGPDGKTVARSGDVLDVTGGWGARSRADACGLGEDSRFAVGPLKVVNPAGS